MHPLTEQMGFVSLTVVIILSSIFGSTQADYKVGVGRADVTGPSAEITFMGYAKALQQGCGVHLRQYARAFIIDDNNKRVVFVTIDACMMGHGIRKEVIAKLQAEFKDMYTFDNVVLSGTHTHGTPGGFLQDVLFDFSILGFCVDTFDALVNGIVKAIRQAHNSMTDATISWNKGTVLDASINRSPASYLFNPEEERKKYEYDTDKDIVQLKFVSVKTKKPIGALNWFAVHGTSMNNTNCLVSSDNAGYASILFETAMEPESLPGRTNFVAAFASTNLGDVTPNIKGPHCLNTGEPCEYVTSTCNGEARFCVAFGPGKTQFESTEIIAKRVFNQALGLFNDVNKTAVDVKGDVRYIHQFVDMPKQTIDYVLPNKTTIKVKGCLPAMGYSFGAGTIDGPGEFDFTQGTNSSNPIWNFATNFIFPPSEEDIACHAPKPILIFSGGIKVPYEWQPEVVATQILKVGNVVITAVPGEFTTMSGRRLRDAVQKVIVDNGGDKDTNVVLAGLSNIYTNYITTPEEYQLQRYEGASTIFGPYTLPIYLNVYKELAAALIKNKSLEKTDVLPFEFPSKDEMMTFITPVLFDTAGWFFKFGDCVQQPPSTVKIGDTVSAKFIAGHPRNDLRTGDTYLTVERAEDDGSWKLVATDANFETKFIWRRTNLLKGSSEAEIVWHVTDNVQPGNYRIRHFGSYKYILGGVYPYEGSTITFKVTK